MDEAHSSQTGESAIKLKTALADTIDALKEHAEIEGIAEDEIDANDKIVKEIINHGKHKNLSFFAFTATPKPETLELFGTRNIDGAGFTPFHVYSMRQAIEEGFILDVLQNYMTYDTCFKIAKNTEENPLLKSSRAAKVIAKYQSLHPYNITQKSQIIVETFMETTRHKIGDKGKMMVVTSSRGAAVKYVKEIRRYVEEKGYQLAVKSMVAFSGSVIDTDKEEYTESKLNKRADGTNIAETQTAAEFHDNFNMIVVAEKFQTGFDEPLLHTMIVDKKLKEIKAVQTLSRLNRTCPGKNDTFVLDFINSAEDMKAAFQQFYQETILEGEVNADLVYKVRDELRGFDIYSDNDVITLADAYFDPKEKKGSEALMGRITAILKPIVGRYSKLEEDQKYNFRRDLRKFTRWYGFVSQVCRTFDEMLLKENAFCINLLRLIPNDPVEIIDLEDKLKLEYYQLKKTFEGEVTLDEEKVVKVTIFVASLSYNDYFYAEAMTKCDIKNWIRMNNNALQYFGGVTPNITPDNCKVAVNKNKDWIDPALNKDFQEWADHNGAVILPAKMRSPQMKPVVENSVKLVTNHILVDMDGMVFYSLEEINRILFKKVDEENRKNFQDLDYSRYDLFVREEKETLLPLPDTKYEYLERKNVKVAQDFSFVFDKVHYSMPRRYLKQELEIRAGEEKIFVYNRHGDLIRTHERSYTPKDWVVVPSDMPKEYNDYGYWNVPYFQQKASNIGPYTRMAIDEVIARFKYPVQSFRSCFGIINFAKRYSKETLESCCKDALIKGRCNYTFISNTIASHYIPPAPKEETPAEPVEVEKGKYKDDDSLYSLKNLLKSQGGSRNEQ